MAFTPEQRSKGGKNVPPAKRGFSVNPEKAREAGRKGGRAPRKRSNGSQDEQSKPHT